MLREHTVGIGDIFAQAVKAQLANPLACQVGKADHVSICPGQSGAGERNRTADLPLTRSFHDPLSAAAFLMRAGLLIIWLHLNVSGLRLVLARGWHRLRLDANCWRA